MSTWPAVPCRCQPWAGHTVRSHEQRDPEPNMEEVVDGARTVNSVCRNQMFVEGLSKM